MILVVDAGNTNVVAACMEQDTVLYAKRYDTGKQEEASYHDRKLGEFFAELQEKISWNGTSGKSMPCVESRETGQEADPGSLAEGAVVSDGRMAEAARRYPVDGAIIASVVPSINGALQEAVQHWTGCEPLFVSARLDTGLQIRYDAPEKLGADLIAGAAGAVEQFGCPVIVVDIGTATTFAVVNGRKEYLGGAICPGPYTAFKGLTDRASQLPEFSLDVTDEIIGTNTINCMRIGALTGHAAMIDGMIDRILAKLGEESVRLVVTGGPAKDIAPLCRHRLVYDGDLVLHGLWKLQQRNQ